jgi:5,10-methylene-tetrahydrofolate dehydrogenase/methenyl tetrahydrofolate cyclohydrolase
MTRAMLLANTLRAAKRFELASAGQQ